MSSVDLGRDVVNFYFDHERALLGMKPEPGGAYRVARSSPRGFQLSALQILKAFPVKPGKYPMRVVDGMLVAQVALNGSGEPPPPPAVSPPLEVVKTADYLRGIDAQTKLAKVRRLDEEAFMVELDGGGYRVTWREP